PARRDALLPADRSGRVALDNVLQLLVVAGAGAGLVVVLDDEPAGVSGVRVDPERLDAECPAERPPLELAAGDRNRLDLLDAGDLHALAVRNASSTIGSMRPIPAQRSARSAVPAQSSTAFASSPA